VHPDVIDRRMLDRALSGVPPADVARFRDACARWRRMRVPVDGKNGRPAHRGPQVHCLKPKALAARAGERAAIPLQQRRGQDPDLLHDQHPHRWAALIAW
jgi:hypothetical protein